MNRLRLRTAISLLALTLATPALWAASEMQVRQSGNISYISGGVSEEDRESLQASAQGYNLKLIFANKGGQYLSDVEIVVNDPRGQRVLDATSEGPWFYAKLPIGRYQISASANGRTLRQSVSLAGQRQNKVDFRWDGERVR